MTLTLCHVLFFTQSYKTVRLKHVHAGRSSRHAVLETHADWPHQSSSYQLFGWTHGWTLGTLQDLLIWQTSPVFTLALQIQNWAGQRPLSWLNLAWYAWRFHSTSSNVREKAKFFWIGTCMVGYTWLEVIPSLWGSQYLYSMFFAVLVPDGPANFKSMKSCTVCPWGL